MAILKALSEINPVTKTLPDESVAMRIGASSVFAPSPVASMISVMVPPGVILKIPNSTSRLNKP